MQHNPAFFKKKSFLSPRLVAILSLKSPVYYCLPIPGGRIAGFIPFQGYKYNVKCLLSDPGFELSSFIPFPMKIMITLRPLLCLLYKLFSGAHVIIGVLEDRENIYSSLHSTRTNISIDISMIY